MSSTSLQRKHIVILGAGAAGMSCAESLSRHPEMFKVTLIERSPNCGGMATSHPIDPHKYGADYINDGVQGGSPQFFNTYKMFEQVGFQPTKVDMQLSFGREPGKDYWGNVFPTDVIDKYQSDISKFGRVLKVIGYLEPVFGLIPINLMLKIFRFSPGFGENLIYPLVALFMGTGQQTPYVSAVVMERVFTDPVMKLFEYSPKTFLANIPEMRAFPCLSAVYSAWAARLRSAGVEILLQHEVTLVKRTKDSVTLQWRLIDHVDEEGVSRGIGDAGEADFDEVVFCCDADTCLRLLGESATWMEKKVLGNVKYLWDISVTHSDKEYMEKYYRIQYSSDLNSKARQADPEAQKQFEFAAKSFKPLYFIRGYPSDPKKVEMSFDLTNYQPQFRGIVPEGGRQKAREDPKVVRLRKQGYGNLPPLDHHVFQTIFLDKDDSDHLWTRGEIDKGKVILEKWWKQQSHRWQHYGGTVPWMMWINGKNRTHFAGSWTILNMHEIAVCSGLAAAYQLGADYPFNNDEAAKRMFVLTLLANHGVRMRKEDRRGILF